MPDILHEVSIAGSKDDVYKALTEGQGIEGWWTTKASAEPKEGSTTSVAFNEMAQFAFTVDKLEDAKEVVWAVNEPSPPGWADTNVTWELSTDEHDHTVVRFGHNGWTSTEGGYASVNWNWGFFLTSLKMYIETGTGTPNVYGG